MSKADPPGPPALLSDTGWHWVTDRLPIACVDILSVVLNDRGFVSHVGLIRRALLGEMVWCHLGGRVAVDETLQEAAVRHVNSTIDLLDVESVLSPTPFFTNQFFRTKGRGFGFDPSKHAITSCYTLTLGIEEAISTVPGGEGDQFRWFSLDALLRGEVMWPGTSAMIEAVPHKGLELVYETLHSDYVSHNELMWQTPVLAMTAMSFLLMIALGSGSVFAKALASALSSFVALASAQLMAVHSKNQRAKADQLWELEGKLGLPTIHSAPRSGPTGPRHVKRWLTSVERWLSRYRSRYVWLVTLLVFGAVSVAAFVMAIAAR